MTRWFQSRDPAPPRFCVVGSPVAHSKSPLIHAAFAAQTGRTLEYDKVEVQPGDLARVVDEFRRAGGAGMNVTVPLKEEAWSLADVRMERAEAAGAANTLWFGEDGSVLADNTDGTGLIRDLEANHGIGLAGRRVLVIGAGGAARGVIPALAAASPAAISITNRTASKAAAVAQACAGRAPIEVLAWAGAAPHAFDVIVNATSLSLRGELPPVPAGALHSGTTCYDMMYGAGPTAFVSWAARAGAALALDGLGMLVEQAAEAFLIWHGIRPSTGPVIAAIRAEPDATR